MIFLGLLFERSEEQLIAAKSRGGVLQNQVNAFQWNCIDGLYENGVENLCIINALPVGTYPSRYTDVVIQSKAWKYKNRQHYQLGSVNLPLLKQWGRYHACKKILRKLQDKEILIYSPYQPFLKAIKRLDRSYKVTLIVPDLPAYYDYGKSGKFRKILRKINNVSIEKCMNRVDRFVLLTDAMKEPLKVGNRPYTVVEGFCSSKPLHVQCNINLKKRIVMYAGSLNRCFGIDVLLKAFEKITSEDYELWLCGGGDYEDEIRVIAQKDERIKFWGYVSSERVKVMQAKATVLVNPRQNIGEYTKYSFPSKTMEYLLSGVPVIGYKLYGIPNEYDNYLHYVEDNSSESLYRVIVKICEDTTGKYKAVAREAVTFLISKKNPIIQSRKILNIMKL